jgi:methionyl-tRNA formyltransferase
MTKNSNSKTDPTPQITPDFLDPLITFEQEDTDQKLKTLKLKELRIIFFGSRDFVIPVIEAVKENFDLEAIVTVSDQPVGRGYKLTPTPVKQHFQDQNVPIFDPEKLDEDFIRTLKNLEPDLFVVAAYGMFLPDELLRIPRFGVLNLHPSLLPKYRGPAPIQNAILNGDDETGMSFMLLDEKMDHGPIIYQTKLVITQQDNFETLGKKLFQHAAEEITHVISHFVKGQLPAKPQNHDQAAFTKLIKKEDGFFEIDNPPSSEKLDQMIRAYYPWPNAWTKWNNKIVKFLPENMVQIEGKKAVKLKDFLNGYPNFPLKQI